jgi:hypothetical protein
MAPAPKSLHSIVQHRLRYFLRVYLMRCRQHLWPQGRGLDVMGLFFPSLDCSLPVGLAFSSQRVLKKAKPFRYVCSLFGCFSGGLVVGWAQLYLQVRPMGIYKVTLAA